LNTNILNHLIRIQPAINRDNTKVYDKYWLNVAINDVEMLADLYESLEINQINCEVLVGIERHFSTELPKSIREGAKAINNLLRVARSRDRGEIHKALYEYRIKAQKIDKNEIEDFFERLIEKFTLIDYLEIDQPFQVGEISNPDTTNIIPKNFSVEAITDLNLKRPAASGYLKFHKKSYQEKIRREIKDKWK